MPNDFMRIHIGPDSNQHPYLLPTIFLRDKCNIEERPDLLTSPEDGYKMLRLENEDWKDFDVFIHWILRGDLRPSTFTNVTDTANPSEDDKGLYVRMNTLYGMAHRLNASEFKNRLMDHFARKMNRTDPVAFHQSHFQPALHLPKLYELYISIGLALYWDQDRCGFLETSSFDQNLAMVYFDILQLGRTLRAGKEDTMLRLEGHFYHEHKDSRETCYLETCNKHGRVQS